MWRMKQRVTEASEAIEIRRRKLPLLRGTSSPVATLTTCSCVAFVCRSSQHQTMTESSSFSIMALLASYDRLCEQDNAMGHLFNLSLPVRSLVNSNQLYHGRLNFR